MTNEERLYLREEIASVAHDMAYMTWNYANNFADKALALIEPKLAALEAQCDAANQTAAALSAREVTHTDFLEIYARNEEIEAENARLCAQLIKARAEALEEAAKWHEEQAAACDQQRIMRNGRTPGALYFEGTARRHREYAAAILALIGKSAPAESVTAKARREAREP